MKKYTKIDDNTLQVEEDITTNTTSIFDYDELLARKERNLQNVADFTAQKDAENAEIDALIVQADQLGIISKQ